MAVAWRLNATALVDSGGLSTFAFPAVPQNQQASVTVSIPGAAAGILWNVFVSNVLVGSTTGSSPYGAIYLGPSDVITLAGTPPSGSDSGVAALVGAIGSLTDTTIAPTAPASGGGVGQTITLLGTIQ